MGQHLSPPCCSRGSMYAGAYKETGTWMLHCHIIPNSSKLEIAPNQAPTSGRIRMAYLPSGILCSIKRTDHYRRGWIAYTCWAKEAIRFHLSKGQKQDHEPKGPEVKGSGCLWRRWQQGIMRVFWELECSISWSGQWLHGRMLVNDSASYSFKICAHYCFRITLQDRQQENYLAEGSVHRELKAFPASIHHSSW